MVEVFAIKVPDYIDDDIFDELMNRVEGSKRERIQRFVRREDQLRGLFADLLIRDIIIQKTGMSNETIRFGTNEFGKPYLIGRDDFHFNLSHSGIWVVAAIDRRPVGIDVEQVADVDLTISRNYFSEDEHNDLMSREDKISYFFTLWTLKESYIKTLGKGLSKPLNSFSMTIGDDQRVVLKSDKGKTIEGINFAQYNIHKDYKMVLCATHDRLPTQVNMQNVDLIMRRFIA